MDDRRLLTKATQQPGAFQQGIVEDEGRSHMHQYASMSHIFQPGDGTRVVMAPRTQATDDPTHVTLIFNFFEELRRLAPVTKR